MSAPRVLIVGQGLAGTALGLELEAGGIDFVIASEGHGDAASRVAAGLINPVTGRRWTRPANFGELRATAEVFYRRAEEQLGVPLWQPLRMTRQWRDAAEQGDVTPKLARGSLAPQATTGGPDGVWIHDAARVDLPQLLAAAARRWTAAGRLRQASVAPGDLHFGGDGVEWEGGRFSLAVLCTGAGATGRRLFPRIPFVAAKGEIIAVKGTTVAAGEARCRGGYWLIGLGAGRGSAGATYEPGGEDPGVSGKACDRLREAAQTMDQAGRLEVTGQAAGIRLTVPDRIPVIGRSLAAPALGICGALGSKGALWAPTLARAWRSELGGESAPLAASWRAERW